MSKNPNNPKIPNPVYFTYINVLIMLLKELIKFKIILK